MAYVGNTPADKTLKLEKQQFTTSATTTYTLSHSVSDPQDIALFINNVRQNPNSSYTVSGTTLTLSAATASTDTMYCVFLGRAIGTVGIGAGSVTKDKVDFISDSSGSGVISKGDGSSIDGSIQLNCHVNSHGIKLKSPPHSAGATYTLTFPNSVTADKFLKTDGSGNLSFASAGITEADQWRLTASKTSTGDITANLERVDTGGFGYIGTGMTESSGIFTFPTTGIYSVTFNMFADNYVRVSTLTTTDNSTFVTAAKTKGDISGGEAASCIFLFDVTDTSTHKVKFKFHQGTGTLQGSTSENETHFTFIRLGDT